MVILCMKIIGFNFTKIVIEREENSPANISINQNINIKDVKKYSQEEVRNNILKYGHWGCWK